MLGTLQTQKSEEKEAVPDKMSNTDLIKFKEEIDFK
jgi:hypothetical protein